jgi:hypothetical protein
MCFVMNHVRSPTLKMNVDDNSRSDMNQLALNANFSLKKKKKKKKKKREGGGSKLENHIDTGRESP